MTFSAPLSCKVYTEQTLADAIVRRLGDDGTASWLEPSVGPGVFLTSIAGLGVEVQRVTALDIEQDSCQHKELARVLEGCDFIRWSLDTEQRFDRIVGNPPYVALSRLSPTLRETALLVRTHRDRAMKQKANYWFVFLCAMLRVLRPGGALGLILPASWDYADYCEDMREYLPSRFQRFEIHRSQRSLFNGVGEGAVVLIAQGFMEPPTADERYEHADLTALVTALNNGTSRPTRHVTPTHELRFGCEKQVCQLRDIADIKIGAVTGDVGFFLFNEQRRQESGIPDDCFKPILSRASHINTAEANREHWEELRDAGERVWLFAPTSASLNHASVQNYLTRPENEGGCKRGAFKVRNRESWHTVQVPDQADGFMSGMSGVGPFICMNAMPGLTASNTLYIVKFRPEINDTARYAWALSMLSSHAHISVLRLVRLYADGLTKHEPKDLLRIELPYPRITHEAPERYREVIALHIRRDHARARRIADEYIA